MSSESAPQAFRPVPRTGVIFVTTEAQKRGFDPASPDWCNLGQGQPETGELPGAPPRVHVVAVDPADQEYAPVAGLWELREAIAAHYNRTYRRGLPSQYSADNVCVSGGGRASLTRAAASLGLINLGHFLPDYTAYEELLDVFKAFTAIPILLDPERAYAFGPDALKKEILGLGLSAVLLSNPSNPTGKVVQGAEMEAWVELARGLDCALLIDEFYAHYVWTGDPRTPAPVSAAAHVRDVNKDPIILFDGLTKNWRYPGWRVTWTLGPRTVIDALSSAGSFLDGGGSKPLQRAALPLFEPGLVHRELQAIHDAFRPKRERMLRAVRDMGIRVDREPEGTFYVWGDLAGLPPPLNDGMGLFRAALEQRVITVPGEFFDINPGKRRRGRASRFRGHARFSFGPSMDVVERALERLANVVRARAA
jgi:aspartate/methionine/tyrosine aminotransferase